MKNFITALLIVSSAAIFISCKEEGAPVLPGLVKSTLAVVTYPSNATILLNNKPSGKYSPGDLSELEPGFYRIDLKLQNYLDTTYYYLIKRGVTDSINVELRENPTYWWQQYKKTTHPIPTNSFNRIRIDSNGVKYLSASNSGIVIYDNAVWTNYNKTNSPLPTNVINDFVKTGNVLWLATDAGLVRFDGTTWTVYNSATTNIPADYITSVCADKNNNIWFGTNTGGLVRFDGVTFRVYNTLNSSIPYDNINTLFVDKDNVLWAGTWGEGVFSFNGSTFKSYNSFRNGLVSNYIRDITQDNNGNMWFASGNFSGGGGISRLSNGFITNITQYNSAMEGSIITSITFDKYNNIWITAPDAGMQFREGSRWRLYNKDNSGIASSSPTGLAIDTDGTKWVLSDGISRYIGYR